MNIENINERLLRTERERDEARAEVEQWRKDYNLQMHKVITCGVAADHVDPKLTLRSDYMQWNSPQAERVRALRERADNAEAELARLRAAANERAIAEMQRVLAVALNSETVAQLAQFATKRLEDLRAEQQAAPVPPPVTPPADAPQRPSVEELRSISCSLGEDHGDYDAESIERIRDAVRILLDDALAARGGAK